MGQWPLRCKSIDRVETRIVRRRIHKRRLTSTIPGDHRLNTRIRTLVSDLSACWRRTPDLFAPPGEKYTTARQREEEARITKMLPGESGLRQGSRKERLRQLHRAKAAVRSAVIGSFRDGLRQRAETILAAFSDAGDDFVRDAGSFDDSLGADEIFQALRNLWILNAIQAAFGLPVRLNASGFAYSLMYPYTDNYLDDPSVGTERKSTFARMLEKRLLGGEAGMLPPKLDRLVAMVETEYPRGDFPEVYGSLLAIHRAQVRSLRQHETDIVPEELPDLSVRKGGTSVLADAYLAKGRLTPGEASFSFRFGAALQLIDDLQDVAGDERNGDHTLFTVAAEGGTLDGMTNKLLRFQHRVLGPEGLRWNRQRGVVFELMRGGCRGLILESIALHPELFSRDYPVMMERYSPVRFGFLRELRQRFTSSHDSLKQAFALKSKRARKAGRMMFAASAAV